MRKLEDDQADGACNEVGRESAGGEDKAGGGFE